MTQLVDPNGRPIPPSNRLRKIDEDVILGLRRKRFHGVIAAGLTPTILIAIFEEMSKGKTDNFLTLAKELEQHDAHYRALIAKRKLAVLRRRPTVKPASEDSRDMFIAEEFEKFVKSPDWLWMTLHCLDALGKGYAATEMIWDFSEGQAVPQFKVRDPRDFTIDVDTLSKVVRKIPNTADTEVPPIGKYIIHCPSLIYGSPVDGAIARTEAILYLYGTLAMQDLADYIERFGTPTLIGEYGSDDQRQEILDGLAALCRAGYGAIPKGVKLTALDGTGGRGAGSASLHEDVMRFLNQEKSKLVLGETMSTEDGSSRSQAEVHADVASHVTDFDCLTIGMSQDEQIVKIWTQFNFPDADPPHVERPGDEREDTKTIAEVLFGMADRGAKIAVNPILQMLGFEPANEDEDVLQPKGSSAPGFAPAQDEGDAAEASP